MLAIDEDDVTFEDIATLCEESQDELADLFFPEVPFYSLIKCEPDEELNNSADSQVVNFLHGDTEVTDISHEETCCSYDCYNTESPENRKKSCSSRKNRTPNTLRHIMEKHRHSERIRHHSLNERLKAICQLIPGSADDSRETKVVMMQRVISYIAFLENTIQFLCTQLGNKPHPSWVLLTKNFREYFQDYFKEIDDTNFGDDEVLAATNNLSWSMEAEDEDSQNRGRLKISSPTVDSTTDSVVPVMVPPEAEKEVTVLSQDSGVPSSSVAGDDDHIAHMWAIYGNQESISVGKTHGDAEVFFSASVDEGVSAVLEISSSTNEDHDTVCPDSDARLSRRPGDDKDYVMFSGSQFSSAPRSPQQHTPFSRPIHSYYTIQKHMPESESKGILRRNKRKQLSPRRSSFHDDYLSDKAYLPSWSTGSPNPVVITSEEDGSPAQKVRVLPYNIRCNHRHPVQRLQATRHKQQSQDCPTLVQVVRPAQDPTRAATASETKEKQSTKLDLRKTSWMNGFMMYSRMNRRRFIKAHPGVHTSHISKIMGHAWRNMKREEQAPYKEKAKQCAQELYRAYTSQPEFSLYSPVSAAATHANTADASSTTSTSVLVEPEPIKTEQS